MAPYVLEPKMLLGQAPDACHAEADSQPSVTPINGVRVGKLLSLSESHAFVTYPGQPGSAAIAALLAVDLDTRHLGSEVVLHFDQGDPMRPIVLGRIRGRRSSSTEGISPRQVGVDADGERLVLHADREITLRCGKASITLTSAGKVLIQGTYVSSRASGVQRIKGGSVQVN